MIKYIFAIAVLSTGMAFAGNNQPAGPVAKEVRHELVMLPYLDVFDNLSYSVDGGVVTLSGQVTRPTLKTDAERVVQRIDGVERVDNRSKCCLSPTTTIGCGAPFTGRFMDTLP